jgi:hypothetical protein
VPVRINDAEKKMPLAVYERPLPIVCSFEPHRSRFSGLALAPCVVRFAGCRGGQRASNPRATLDV